MYTGPHVVKDDLVFGYDTGYGVADYKTITRFFKGAPTINYIHNQNAVAQDSYTSYSATNSGNWNTNHPNAIRAYNAQGGDITGYINAGVGNWENTRHGHWQLDPILKKPVVVMNDVAGQWKAKSFDTGLGSWTSQGKTHGSTYTISWLQWVDHLSKNAKAGLYTKNSSGSNGFHDGIANSPSSYNTKLHTWQRVYQTYTTNANRDLSQTLAAIYMYGHYNVRATVKIADVQFTWGSTPFPFSAEYERSSTQSLIDLKRTTDIDVSNVSFDSTGQPEFDGTDDRISLTDNFDLNDHFISGGDFSIEAVIYMRESPSQNGGVLCNQKYLSETDPAGFGLVIKDNNTYALNLTNNTPASYQHIAAIPFNVDNYHHIVYTFNSSTGSIVSYSNGSQYSSSTSSSYSWNIPTDSTRTYVAWNTQGGWSNYINMDIPVIKVYSKALTAGEVKQNYNAYKHRFNI